MFLTIVGAILLSVTIIVGIILIVLKLESYFSPISRLKRAVSVLNEVSTEEEKIMGRQMVSFLRDEKKLTDEQIKEAAEKYKLSEKEWSQFLRKVGILT